MFAAAQQLKTTNQNGVLSVPRIVRYSGTVPLAVPAGQREVRVTFRLYANATGGSALWRETQTVTVQDGKFAALIGAVNADGIPEYWFDTNQARWLEVQVGDEPVGMRIALASVPYAFEARNAETLGGKPLSAFVLRDEKNTSEAAGAVTSLTTSYATLGSNNFVGTENIAGSLNVTGLTTLTTSDIVSQLFWIQGTATTGGVIAVKAENASSSGTGIMGIVTSTTGNTVGVIGRSDSVVGNGVYGVTTSSTGSAEAISGTAMATEGHGVGGYAVATTGASVGVFGKSYSASGTGAIGEASVTSGSATTYGVIGRAHSGYGVGVWGQNDSVAGTTIGVRGTVGSLTGIAGYFVNAAKGNILVGISGTSKVFRVDGTGKVYANGGTVASGADFAESVAVRGPRAEYEPGDVLMLDEESDRQLRLADEAYSTRVAGIYSTKPGTLSTNHDIDSKALEDEVPMAVIGIVPCKVTTANGEIHRGDLLVSSGLPGYAMKGTERERMLGAIVGKAMQELKTGTGVIEVLVTLE
jgi:hypothetical protein